MRLALVIASLQGGGAERVMATLANAWVARGDQITLITLDSVETDFYPLDSRVRRVGLNLVKSTRGVADKLRFSVRRVAGLRNAVREAEPDVVLSFVNRTNLLSLLAAWGLPVPVVVAEHIDTRHDSCPASMRLLRRVLYPHADALVVLTKSVEDWARRVMPHGRVAVIPNSISSPRNVTPRRGQNKIAAVGRLHPQKGFDVLMEAFAKIAPRHPQWSLEIFGEGPERKSLETLIRNRGLTGRVTLRGLVSDIHSHLVAADLYVMSSRYEGFPLALLEAMACGCPVISTDCPSGPKEIIRVGHDGWLVPREDVDALADGMSRLMDSEVERRRLGANATAICERFSIAKILAMWDDLFARVSSGRERTAVVSRIEGTPSPAKRVA